MQWALALVVAFSLGYASVACVGDETVSSMREGTAEHHHDADSEQSHQHDGGSSGCCTNLKSVVPPSAGLTVQPRCDSVNASLVAALLPSLSIMVQPTARSIYDHGPPGNLLPNILLTSVLSSRGPPVSI
jgi:hypothetical protein